MFAKMLVLKPPGNLNKHTSTAATCILGAEVEVGMKSLERHKELAVNYIFFLFLFKTLCLMFLFKNFIYSCI